MRPVLLLLVVVAAVAAVATLLFWSGSPTAGIGGLGTGPVTAGGASTGTATPPPGTAAVPVTEQATTPAGPTTAPVARPHGPQPPSAPPSHPGFVKKGDAVRGVLRDPSGRPVAGAPVEIHIRTAGGEVFGTVITGPDGTFAAASPESGGATLRVAAPGFPTLTCAYAAGQTVSLTLPTGATIEGHVRAPSGESLGGGFVAVENLEGGGIQNMAVQADGTFRVEQMAEGRRYRIKATHPSFAHSAPMEVTAPATGLVLALELGATLVIQVVDADGRTLPRFVNPGGPAPIPLHSYAELSGEGAGTTLSNWTVAEGSTIRLPGLRQGRYTVTAQVRGHARGELRDIAVPPSGAIEVKLVLQRGAPARLRARDPSGNPIMGAVAIPAGLDGTPWGALVSGTTGGDGTCAVGPLAPGHTILRVRANGFEQGEIEAVADSAGGAAELVLQPRP